MKFTTLKIENFLAITEGELNLADRGLVLIQGINNDDTSADSNGAGKSSVADALCWTLYGTTARGVTGDSVINDSVGKATRVQVEIADGDDTYTIARHRKHKTGKNSVTVQHLKSDGTITDLTKGTDKLTQEVINKIIGSSYEVFKSAVYAGQEQMPDLPAMTDKNLKILIEEASGVTLLEEAYAEARTRLNQKKQGVETLDNKIQTLKDQVQWLEDQAVQVRAQKDAFEVNRQSRVNAIKGEIRTRMESINKLKAEIAAIDETKITSGIATCDKKIAAVKEEQVKLIDLDQKLSKADSDANVAQSSVVRLDTSVRGAKQALEAVDHKIGCPCSECGRPMTKDELGAARTAAQERLDQVQNELTGANATLESAQKQRETIKGERDAFAQSMTDVSEVTRVRGVLSDRLNGLNQLKSKLEQETQMVKRIAEDVKQIATEANPFENGQKDVARQIEEKKKEIEPVIERRKQLEADIQVADSVAKVFSPAGVRAHILDEVTPFLNEQTSKYLSTLSDGNIEATWSTLVPNTKGELREKFTIEVTKLRRSQSFAGLSGGEKRKVRVATALALQDLVATRATKPIELFIGDEIDDALDSAGLERLMQILEEKAGERGSVFVISHRSLRDWISNVVLVEMKNDKSIISEATT